MDRRLVRRVRLCIRLIWSTLRHNHKRSKDKDTISFGLRAKVIQVIVKARVWIPIVLKARQRSHRTYRIKLILKLISIRTTETTLVPNLNLRTNNKSSSTPNIPNNMPWSSSRQWWRGARRICMRRSSTSSRRSTGLWMRRLVVGRRSRACGRVCRLLWMLVMVMAEVGVEVDMETVVGGWK